MCKGSADVFQMPYPRLAAIRYAGFHKNTPSFVHLHKNTKFEKLKSTGQILAFFMLCVMLFIASRFTVLCSVVKVQKKQFRQTALLQQKNELKQIMFEANELYKNSKGVEWEENNAEIILNGTYYEVVFIEKKGNSYIVNIIEDTKESALFKNFFDKTDQKGQLAEYLTLLLGVNFNISEPIKFRQTPGQLVEHQTAFTLKSGIELCHRTVKPPRV